MPKKPISIASRKAKARVAQNWVAQKIAELTGYTCGKDELICGRPMGQSGVDVQLIGEAREDFPWSVECFAPNTLILTKNGYMPISKVSIGDKVLTHKGRFRKVLNIYKRTSDTGIEIKAKHLSECINCTCDHPFENFDGNWNSAEDLKYLSHLCMTNETFVYNAQRLQIWDDKDYNNSINIDDNHITCQCGCGTIIPKINKHGEARHFVWGHSGSIPKNKNIPYYVSIDSKLLYLFGLYIAEGHISNDLTRVVWTFNQNEVLYKEQVIDICKNKFNQNIYSVPSPDSKAIQLSLGSCILAKFFLTTLGTGSLNKCIGKFTFLPKRMLISLLQGYFNGDGCMGDTFARAESVSRRLIYELQFILLRFGIFSSITKKIHNGFSDNPLYSIQISRSSLDRFYHLMNSTYTNLKSMPPIKNSEDIDIVFNLCKNRIYSPVSTITHYEKQTLFYNLNVAEDESYIIEGGIVVHNCKNQQKVNLYDAIKQAKDNQMNGTDWLVILKKNNEDYVAVLDAEVFFDLLRLIPGRKKGR